MLPVFVRVRELDKDLREHEDSTIWDSLGRHCTRLLQLTAPAGFLHREMNRRGLLVLFDGLDEAATPARRRTVMDAIHAFAGTLGDSSRVMISSRPHEYAEQKFDAAEYAHFDLCEFDKEEIRPSSGNGRRCGSPTQRKRRRRRRSCSRR
ncbi:MAG: hypothetical protein R2762_01120 [Bryobacteraceae bacterium]